MDKGEELVCRGAPTTVAACVQEFGKLCRGICTTKFVKDAVAQLGSKRKVIRV